MCIKNFLKQILTLNLKLVKGGKILKATGVVRRIDDLGRIVIPKEIRRTLRIKEGDPLEIFTDKEGEVILKKYSPIGELSEFATGYAETLSKTTGHIACITDKDSVIAVSGGSKKEFLEQSLSTELEKLMENKEVYTSKRVLNRICIYPYIRICICSYMKIFMIFRLIEFAIVCAA